MRKSERQVGRADHNLEGAQQAADGKEPGTETPSTDSADQRGHGAHGKGRDDEKVLNDAPVEPGRSGWGSEGAGGSVSDTRPKK